MTHVKLYINGSIEGQSVTYYYFDNFSLSENSTKRIGNNQDLTEAVVAEIDEVRLWSRALSAEEVLERSSIDSQLALNIDEEINLEGYWKMDCNFNNEVNLTNGNSFNTSFTVNQHCYFGSCNESEYLYLCPADLEGNNDCNSCDPPEGCTDEFACNFDPLAIINIQANCFYVFDLCYEEEYPEYYDCDCKCINDADGDEVCDEVDCLPDEFNPDQDCTNIHEFENSINDFILFDLLGRKVKKDSKNVIILKKRGDGEVEKNIKF